MTACRASIALAFLAALSAIILTTVALSGSLMPGDRALADALQATPGGRFLEPPADWIALWYVERGLVLVLAAFALWRRAYGLAGAALLIIAGAALNPVFKEAIERERPAATDLIIRESAEGYGFPSGHSMSAALFYGYALVVALRLTGGHVRLALATTCLAAIALIGWDRVYDGAHWPSDVAGGWAIGAALLAGAFWLAGFLLKVVRARHPE